MRILLFLALFIAGASLWAGDAIEALRVEAERGDSWAQLNLGAAYDNGIGVTSDPAQAILWYRRAAEQGLAQAQFNLGHSYAMGNGTTQNYTEAVRWLGLAADQEMAGHNICSGSAIRKGWG